MFDMLIVFIFTRNQDQLSFKEIPPKADVDQGLRNHVAPSATPERPINHRHTKARTSRARVRGSQAGGMDEPLDGGESALPAERIALQRIEPGHGVTTGSLAAGPGEFDKLPRAHLEQPVGVLKVVVVVADGEHRLAHVLESRQ